ncbi:MAG TPA: hypothetical protein VLW84_12820 [Terriglobales bacterium]|nr:hypothetical protein [Terriglobales bacterium]
MRTPRYFINPIAVAAMIAAFLVALQGEESVATATVPVRMVVTVEAAKDKPAPVINREDVLVHQGKQRLKVLEWTPAKGDNAALDMFILIDDAADTTSLGSKLNDLRAWVNAQPATTTLALGYMSNATFTLVQDFTADHALVANSLRLSRGFGVMSSPYLSLIDLTKRWSGHSNRRAVLMISDGIDRYRNAFGMGGGFGGRGLQPISPDVQSASDAAQRAGVPVYSMYVLGTGRIRTSFWQVNLGQASLSKLSDDTGGESFYLGMGDPVSYQPYLNDLQKLLDNQYLLTFGAKPQKKAGLQTVRIQTEVPNAELRAADSVWVPAAGKSQ